MQKCESGRKLSFLWINIKHFSCKSSVFPCFKDFQKIRKRCFSNFMEQVIHSLHRFFHRFCRHFPCRNSLYSVFIWELRTIFVITKKSQSNFFITFWKFQNSNDEKIIMQETVTFPARFVYTVSPSMDFVA